MVHWFSLFFSLRLTYKDHNNPEIQRKAFCFVNSVFDAIIRSQKDVKKILHKNPQKFKTLEKNSRTLHHTFCFNRRLHKAFHLFLQKKSMATMRSDYTAWGVCKKKIGVNMKHCSSHIYCGALFKSVKKQWQPIIWCKFVHVTRASSIEILHMKNIVSVLSLIYITPT